MATCLCRPADSDIAVGIECLYERELILKGEREAVLLEVNSLEIDTNASAIWHYWNG